MSVALPKRRKTFTGCWTCRTRKIRCDLKRPACQRCLKAGIKCAGYDIKLIWSTPLKLNDAAEKPKSASRDASPQNSGDPSKPRAQFSATADAEAEESVGESSATGQLPKPAKSATHTDATLAEKPPTATSQPPYNATDRHNDQENASASTDAACQPQNSDPRKPHKKADPKAKPSATQTKDSTKDQYFQRRTIDFVEYPPHMKYTVYEDMDRDLNTLHSPGESLRDRETMVLGPFGVFKGTNRGPNPRPARRSRGSVSASSDSTVGSPHQLRSVPVNSGNNSTSRKRSRAIHESDLAQTPEDSADRRLSLPDNLPIPDTFLTTMSPATAFTIGFSPAQHPDMAGTSIDSSLAGGPEIGPQSPVVSTGKTYPALAEQHKYPDAFSPSAHAAYETATALSLSSFLENGFLPSDSVLTSHETYFRGLYPADSVERAEQEMLQAMAPPGTPGTPQFAPPAPPSEPQHEASEAQRASTETEGEKPAANDDHKYQVVRPGPPHVQPRLPYRNPSNVLSSIASIIPEPSIQLNALSDSLDLGSTSSGSTGGSGSSPALAVVVGSEARLLLHYYETVICSLMSVVQITVNPWRKLHHFRAVHAMGELACRGTTSSAKNAILNGVLAIAAFNLQSKYPRGSERMLHYLNLGIQLRSQATGHLKECLLQDKSEYKYKDVLTAALCMVTIDVVWGTMSDCRIYLGACESFVEARDNSRRSLSQKAHILHRIYSFIKLVEESTDLDVGNIREKIDPRAFEEEEVRSDGRPGGRTTETETAAERQARRHKAAMASLWIEPGTTDYNFLSDGPKSRVVRHDPVSTDKLYGLPVSLLLLFREVTDLVRYSIYYRSRGTLPPALNRLCNEVESELLNWKLDPKMFEPLDSPGPAEMAKDGSAARNEGKKSDKPREFADAANEALYHHVMSFYHALIIYFFREVRQVHSMMLQSNVKECLEHLVDMQSLVARKITVATPLMWQGFIAACEAIDSDLQEGFKDWLKQLSTSGLGTYWGARQVIDEVWKRRQAGEEHCGWVDVTRDWEMNLLLS